MRGQPTVKQAEQAIATFPGEPQLLAVACLAALREGKPEICLKLQKRLRKRFQPNPGDFLYEAIALAQQRKQLKAQLALKKAGIGRDEFLDAAAGYFPFWNGRLYRWTCGWAGLIWARPRDPVRQPPRRTAKKPPPPPKSENRGKPAPRAELSPPPPPQAPVIPFDVAWRGEISYTETSPNPAAFFRLRRELAGLRLQRAYDELLCRSSLPFTPFPHQIETARKALKQFRGRVLLADEVGLGKTIEAGMIISEYLARGMANRILILTPASLVGQWQEEMATKFGLPFLTSRDPLARHDPSQFWSSDRVIASIATARRERHQVQLARQVYDVVVVDEAHHLRNRSTQNWKLVNSVQKRFLVLLSATPVQNNLVELYNLLTLLKPGIFKTEKDFRTAYMVRGQPRQPANRDQMRRLMREVMIRNTRALVDVRLPPRHARTFRCDPTVEEGACYQELSRFIAESHEQASTTGRLALSHMLRAAGSSPAAAAESLRRYGRRHPEAGACQALVARYEQLEACAKEKRLLELLASNPREKKLVFAHHRPTLTRLGELFDACQIAHARYDGSMPGSAKDEAVARFAADVPVLLTSESGGEGRNIQFANTLINYDLPWNPMAIEQRIGRIHRIGQTREVFVFNLATRQTVEDRLLDVLDEKLNMFELVVGEVEGIVGEVVEERDFSDLVFKSWLRCTQEGSRAAFDELGDKLVQARSRHEAVKALEEELFGDEFEVA
jgi:superfamily II DNA or RNA helicase